MRIAVIGFGHVGVQLGRLWLSRGHQVTAGLRAGSKDRAQAENIGVAVAEPAAAARHADVIVLALPWQAVEETLTAMQPLHGKIILDATNPLGPDLGVLVPEAGSAGQQVVKWAGGAKVVKAFNTIGASLFGDSTFNMFYCGDDDEAKNVARSLIDDTGMQPVDVGPLKNAAYLEQIAGLWIDLATKGRIEGAFGFNLVK